MTCGQSARFCRLILTCTVIRSPPRPPRPPVYVVTSLCRECEYQRLPPLPSPPPLFMVFPLVNLNVLHSETAEESCTLVFYLLFCVLLLWGCVWVTVRNWRNIFLFHYLWKVIKKILTSWNCLNGILFIEKTLYTSKYINDLCIVRLLALWVIVQSAWNSSGCSVIINGGRPRVDLELSAFACVCLCARVRANDECESVYV